MLETGGHPIRSTMSRLRLHGPQRPSAVSGRGHPRLAERPLQKVAEADPPRRPSHRGDIEAKTREWYRRFYRRPGRLVREMRNPVRLAGKVARYFTLFRKRA